MLWLERFETSALKNSVVLDLPEPPCDPLPIHLPVTYSLTQQTQAGMSSFPNLLPHLPTALLDPLGISWQHPCSTPAEP